MMRCVDIFAGCGGLSLGFEKAGFEIVAAFDNWNPAIEVYKQNFLHPIFNLDLNDEPTVIEKIRLLAPALIMGGPPCQDFSSAGKRNLKSGRADLTYRFANIVTAVRPRWFVMENVQQIQKSGILQEVIQQFALAGYGLTNAILNAAYCGVPQARTRFFLIGHLGDKAEILTRILKNNLAGEPMTLRDYFGSKLGIQYYYRHPRSYNRRAIFSIDEPSPTIRGVNRPVPKTYKLHSGDPQAIDLNDLRPLTTLERSLIQTFPKDFKFLGTKTNLEQMIGNAVPVNLAMYVANAIRIYLEMPQTDANRVEIQEQLFNDKVHSVV